MRMLHMKVKFPVYKISLAERSLPLKITFLLNLLSSLSYIFHHLSVSHIKIFFLVNITTVHLADIHIL